MTKEQQFWDWFKNNEAEYFFLNKIDDEDEKENLLNEFLEHLHHYCENLFFQVGGLSDEKQDLIISAEGNIDFFDAVEALVNQAPELEYWNVIAFKPVMEGAIIEYNGIKMDYNTMYFMPLENKASTKTGLRIFIEDYSPNFEKDFLFAAYLVLDNILGEKSNALDIGYVEMKNLSPDVDKHQLIELAKLPRYVKWKKAKYSN